MVHEIKTCPICSQIISFDGKKVVEINGITFNVGYSIGGWGSRRDFVEFSEEVCYECFKELEVCVQGFISKYKILKGCRKQTLRVNSPAERKMGDKVYDLFKGITQRK